MPLRIDIVVWSVIIWVASFGLHAQTTENDPRAAFEKELESARRVMKSGKFAEAKSVFEKLIENHISAEYATPHALTLADDLKTCSFRSGYTPPTPKSILGGNVQSYDSKTGQLKVRYASDETVIFKEEATFRVYPAAFAGPYTIEFKGKAWRTGSDSRLLCCAKDERSIQLALDRECRFYRTTRAGADLISSFPLPFTFDKPFSLKLYVRESSVYWTANGKTIAKTTRVEEDQGVFGFKGIPLDEILIDGRIEPSFVQRQVDAKTNEALDKFESKWNPSRDLPKSLVAKLEAMSDKATKTDNHLVLRDPKPESKERNEFIDAIHQALEDDAVAEARSLIESESFAELRSDNRTWLTGLVVKAEGKKAEAAEYFKRVVDASPKFAPAYFEWAEVVADRRKPEIASEILARGKAANPKATELVLMSIIINLRMCRVTEAQAIVREALSSGHSGTDLLGLSRIVEKAVRGPDWPKAFEYKSSRYHVYSDIDKETCTMAGKLLDEAMLIYKARLRDVDSKAPPFKVYLFAGQEGYLRYCENAGQDKPTQTAGVYIPLIKQLLIWNLPQRADMMKTVRHEGFHQYLDLLVEEPPTWFNEGMADYFEKVSYVGGNLELGSIERDQIETSIRLMESSAFRMDLFLRMPHRSFYRAGTDNYAIAWGIIHYLRHGGPEPMRLFSRFFDDLCSGVDGRTAIDKHFPLDSTQAFHSAVLSHLRRQKY